MAEADSLRVGLIGYGLAGASFHAPLIEHTPGLRLSAIVTSAPERREQARLRHPQARLVPDADRLWELADELDLVVVASPNRTHVPLARAALCAGLPVVVDKPLAATAADAAGLAAEAADRGLTLSVFQNRRWDGDFLTLQRLLADGALGEPYRFESRFERWRPVPRPGWREQADPAEAGGVLYDLGSHLIDQARVLFGPVLSVYAELSRRRPGVQVEDDAFLALTHASGVRAHLWMSLASAEHQQRFRVLGSRGAYVKGGMDVQEAALRAGGSPADSAWGEEPREQWGEIVAGESRTPVPTVRGDYPAFYARVAAALRGAAPPPVDPADAVAVLHVIEAARRSAEGSGVVEVPGG